MHRLAHRPLDRLGQGPGEGVAELLAQRVQGPAQTVEVNGQQAARGDQRTRNVSHEMPPLVPERDKRPGR